MSRRGLSLLEVLAATALLVLLAGTCVPLLRRALPAFSPPDHPFELFELAGVADSVVAEPVTFGIELPFAVDEHRISWPGHPDQAEIIVRLITADTPEPEHGWLAFSSGPWTVHRWVKLDPGGAEEAP